MTDYRTVIAEYEALVEKAKRIVRDLAVTGHSNLAAEGYYCEPEGFSLSLKDEMATLRWYRHQYQTGAWEPFEASFLARHLDGKGGA